MGWAAVAGLAGMAAVVTALLLWWRWRQFGAAWGHCRGGAFVLPYLLAGLALVLNGVRFAARKPTGGDHVAGLFAVVLGTVAVTVSVGGLLAEYRWKRG